MRSFFAFFLFLLSTVLLSAEDIEDHCGQHNNVLRDSSGRIVWHNADEMNRLTAKVIPAEPPRVERFVYEGFVSFRVLVGTNGDVLCIWDATGHPMMIPGAVRAVHEWKFKTKSRNGKPVEYVGKVSVPVSSK